MLLPPSAPLNGAFSRVRVRPWVLLAWVPALVVLVPALIVFVRLGAPAGEAWAHLYKLLLPTYIWHTALLVVLVTCLALILGVPSAWWVATTSFPGRRIFQWALLLPLAIPGYIAALAYVDAAESFVPFYIWVRQKFGIGAFLFTQQASRWGLAVLVLGSTLFPYVYLTSLAAFTRQASGPLDAARTLGVSPGKLFWRVALPLGRPAVVAGASLVAFETLNEYGVVSYFGLTPLTVGVFRVWLSEGELNTAIRLSTFLLVLALFTVGVERTQRGRRAFEAEPSDTPVSRRKLGAVRGVVTTVLCLVPLMTGFLIPAFRLSRWAWLSWEEMAWAPTMIAAWHSFSLAAGASGLIVAASVLTISVERTCRAPSLRVAKKTGLLGYAFPSALVAVGTGALMAQLSQWPGLGMLALSASALGLVFAYFVRFLAVGLQPVDAGFKRISPSLHEAARTLGCRPWKALWQVDLPLASPFLIAAGMLAFIDIFKELTLTLVLRPFNFETLATRIFRLTDESRVPEAALPSLVLVAICLLGLIPLAHLSYRRTP